MQFACTKSVTLFFSNFTARIPNRRLLAAMLFLAPLSPALAGTLYIGGTPATTLPAPGSYYFRPWVAGSDKATAKFAIHNKPYWASFDPSTGPLSGKAYLPNVGTYSNISITASTATSSPHMPPFTLVASTGSTSGAPGSATLSWHPPTTNTNGSALTNLAGYRIKYGTSSTNLSRIIQIANPGTTRYVITNLAPGTYFFGINAYNNIGTQSRLSALVSKKIN